jgi:hypothetical protein
MNDQSMTLQNELCALSTNCAHLVEPAATHNIARERPDVVVAAIGLAGAVTNRWNAVDLKGRNISRTLTLGGR